MGFLQTETLSINNRMEKILGVEDGGNQQSSCLVFEDPPSLLPFEIANLTKLSWVSSVYCLNEGLKPLVQGTHRPFQA